MKNYLIGFGAIMAVGLAFALSGSNVASNMLATILDVATVNTTTANVATTTTDTTSVGWLSGIAQTSTTSSGVATTTSPVPARIAILNGLTANQILQGAQLLNVYASSGAISAKFVVTNIQTNASIVVDAVCVVGAPNNDLTDKCTGEMGTLTMANGKYTIVAHVMYGDNMISISNEVGVYIYNVAPRFIFNPITSPIAGIVTIGGEITAATAVEFLYMPTGSTQQIRIGNAIYAGGTTQSKWTYEWDTKLVPNGYYAVSANVTSRYNNGIAYRAGDIPVKIVNEIPVVEPIITAPTTTIPTETQKTILPVPELVAVAPKNVLTPEELAKTMSATGSKLPTTDQTQQETTAKPSSEPSQEFGMTAPEPVATQTKPADQNSATQNNAPTQAITQTSPATAPVVPVPPVVQRIQDIAVSVQSGNNTAAVERKVAALQKELWGDVNPASPTVQAKMQYQSAKQFGTTVNTTVMRVAEIALSTTTEETIVSVATTTAKGVKTTIKEKRQVVKEKVRLAGKALPNMYVTLYIYSEIPTIAVVKADRNGNWVYELNNKLADGRHEAYVTINDRTGKVVAKSSLFGFVKTAEAITPENNGLANIAGLTNEPIQPVEAAKRTYGLIAFTIIGGGLLIGILLVIRSFRSKRQDLI